MVGLVDLDAVMVVVGEAEADVVDILAEGKEDHRGAAQEVEATSDVSSDCSTRNAYTGLRVENRVRCRKVGFVQKFFYGMDSKPSVKVQNAV